MSIHAPAAAVLGMPQLVQLLLGRVVLAPNESPAMMLQNAFTFVAAYDGCIVVQMRRARDGNGTDRNILPWLRGEFMRHPSDTYYVVGYREIVGSMRYEGRVATWLTPEEFRAAFRVPQHTSSRKMLLRLHELRERQPRE